MTGDVRGLRNVLLRTYLEIIVGIITISHHLRRIALDKAEEHELGHFLNVICFCFRSIHGMVPGLYGLKSLREITIHFRFPRLKGLSEVFVYCLYHIVVVRRYDLDARESAMYFQILEAAYQTLHALAPSNESAFNSDFKPDHNYHVSIFEDYKAPQTDRIGAGPSSATEPGSSS